MRGADDQFWSIQVTAFETEQNLSPTLGGLAHSILDGQEPLLATDCEPNNHKGTEFVVLIPQAAVNTICPDVDEGLIVQLCFSPAVVFIDPVALFRQHVLHAPDS
jgi:hypothetical protein